MKKIKNILKTNNLFYNLYSYLFSYIIKMIGIFVPVRDNCIIFNSFGGQKYDDSPKVIYEYMKSNDKYKDFEFYWVFNNPSEFNVSGAKIIKNNSFKFFVTALKCKYWITNSSMERGLVFKRKNNICINTWHGTALKHIGKDENISLINYRRSKNDYMFAQSEFDRKIFSRVFDIDINNIILSGLPRNDELFNVFNDEIESLKAKFNIDRDKKIILYAPTFRDFSFDIDGNYFAPPIDLTKWRNKLGDKFVLLFRTHYFVSKTLNVTSDDFIVDVSKYPCLNDLLKISDILISDYSSIMFDFSILERPIFNFTYDYDEYKQKRGMYFELKDKLPYNCFENEDELLNKLLTYDIIEEQKITKKFKSEFVQTNGNSVLSIDSIIN